MPPGAVAAGSGHLDTDPPLCWQAVAARAAAARAARLAYTQEEVMVELVAGEAEALAAGGGAAAGAGERAKGGGRGRRARSIRSCSVRSAPAAG